MKAMIAALRSTERRQKDAIVASLASCQDWPRRDRAPFRCGFAGGAADERNLWSRLFDENGPLVRALTVSAAN